MARSRCCSPTVIDAPGDGVAAVGLGSVPHFARSLSDSGLAATGFGEFQSLDSGDDEIAFRRNRRIEFKLTQR